MRVPFLQDRSTYIDIEDELINKRCVVRPMDEAICSPFVNAIYRRGVTVRY